MEPKGGGVFEVELTDNAGQTYAMAPIPADRLLVLRCATERIVSA